MTFKAEITIGDMISIAGFVAAACGLFLAYLQMRKSNRQKRAEFIIGIYNEFASSTDMQDIYYKIEYGEFSYSNEFHKSKEEKKLDKLLGLFENISKLYEMGNITFQDMKIVAYKFVVIFKDTGVNRYLSFLESWTKQTRLSFPYSSFRRVGKVLTEKSKQENV